MSAAPVPDQTCARTRTIECKHKGGPTQPNIRKMRRRRPNNLRTDQLTSVHPNQGQHPFSLAQAYSNILRSSRSQMHIIFDRPAQPRAHFSWQVDFPPHSRPVSTTGSLPPQPALQNHTQLPSPLQGGLLGAGLANRGRVGYSLVLDITVQFICFEQVARKNAWELRHSFI